MDQVSVLGVLQTQQRPVRRQSTSEEPALIDAADADRLARPVDLLRGTALERDVDGEPVAVADSRGHDARCLRQSLAPAVGSTLQEGSGLPTEEGLYAPAARLVPGLVLEPQDSLSVEGGHAVDHADGVVGHPAASTRGHVPGVHLPDAGLVGRVDDPFGRVRRPLGEK